MTGRIVRHSYQGDSRDYFVAIDISPVQLRVIARPTQRFDVGDLVQLELPPPDWRSLAHRPALNGPGFSMICPSTCSTPIAKTFLAIRSTAEGIQ